MGTRSLSNLKNNGGEEDDAMNIQSTLETKDAIRIGGEKKK